MPTPQFVYGSRTRGVTFKDVSAAADALLHEGLRPTVERIRLKIGSGSPNTITPLLDAWWKRLSGRLDAGSAAFHRLPERVAQIAEALWLTALDEARGRATIERAKERHPRPSATISTREGEVRPQSKKRDKAIAHLNTQLRLMTASLEREKAALAELTRKIKVLESGSRGSRSP